MENKRIKFSSIFIYREKGFSCLILINVLAFFIFLGLVEGTARIYIYFTRGKSTVGLPERTLYLEYKPFVMSGPNFDENLLPYKYPKINQYRKYRILLLGGSTAAGFPVDILAKAFSGKFIDKEFEVINAAVGGYNARQEAIVATIWGLQLEPDMIITLDGANDLIHRLRVKQAGTFFLNPAYDLA